MNKEFDWVLKFTKEAGEIALKHQKQVTASFKSKGQIVTEADLEISNLFSNYIKENTDDNHCVLDEETSSTVSSFIKQSEGKDYIWIIDPIDGTRTYFQGMNLWGIMISLFHKKEPILSVCYNPARKELIYADESEGYLLNNAFTKEEIKSSLRVNNHPLDGESIVLASSWLQGYNNVRFKNGKYTIMDLFSDAVNHCMCHNGQVHGAFFGRPMKLWDVAVVAMFAKHSEMKFFNFKTKEEFTSLKFDIFNEEDWSLKDLWLCCRKEHFEDIKTIIEYM